MGAWTPALITVGVASVLQGVVALSQSDHKRTSVNHMGYIVLALGAVGTAETHGKRR
ncbi:UNVERIFIED_ORG: NADH:ubiquinone oxidoreductase subunit 4 (subunit M) [Arthrobacter sp. UYCu721]